MRLGLSDTYNDDDCPLAVFWHPGVAPESTVSIREYTENIPGNEKQEPEELQYNAGDSYVRTTLSVGDYPSGHIVATTFLSPSSHNETPLFYYYELRWDHNGTKDDIEVFSSDGRILNDLDYEYGALLYPNGEPATKTWGTDPSGTAQQRIRLRLPDISDGEWYVKYNKYVRGITTENWVECINDIYPVSGLTFSTHPNGTTRYGHVVNFETKPAASGILYVKRPDRYRVRVLPPAGDPEDNWYLRITNGTFEYGGKVYRIPDVSLQSAIQSREGEFWVMTIVQEKASLLDPRTIKVKNGPLYIPTSGYPDHVPLELVDYHSEGRGRDDGNQWGITIYINDGVMSNRNIRDWSCWGQKIFLVNPIDPKADVRVTYQIRRDEVLILKSIDLNPTVGHVYPGLGYHENISSHPVRIALKPWNNSGDRKIIWTYAGWPLYTNSDPDNYTFRERLGDAVILADVSVSDTPTEDVEIVDIRREGGGINPKYYYTFKEHYYTI